MRQACGQRGVKEGLLPAGVNRPAGIAFAGAGDLLVADAAENAILLIR
jgi:hypothetical protein